jgi:hypothetical protein
MLLELKELRYQYELGSGSTLQPKVSLTPNPKAHSTFSSNLQAVLSSKNVQSSAQPSRNQMASVATLPPHQDWAP